MRKERRFSLDHGAEGCVVSLIVMTLLMLAVSLILTEWLQLISHETERILALLIWLPAISVGGYYAARRGRTTGWTNALVVGVFAELFVVIRLMKGTSLLGMMDESGFNWRRLVALGLTIPAAMVGGVIWQMTCRSDGADDAEASKADGE